MATATIGNWWKLFDPHTKQFYYYNSSENRTCWTLDDDVVKAAQTSDQDDDIDNHNHHVATAAADAFPLASNLVRLIAKHVHTLDTMTCSDVELKIRNKLLDQLDLSSDLYIRRTIDSEIELNANELRRVLASSMTSSSSSNTLTSTQKQQQQQRRLLQAPQLASLNEETMHSLQASSSMNAIGRARHHSQRHQPQHQQHQQQRTPQPRTNPNYHTLKANLHSSEAERQQQQQPTRVKTIASSLATSGNNNNNQNNNLNNGKLALDEGEEREEADERRARLDLQRVAKSFMILISLLKNLDVGHMRSSSSASLLRTGHGTLTRATLTKTTVDDHYHNNNNCEQRSTATTPQPALPSTPSYASSSSSSSSSSSASSTTSASTAPAAAVVASQSKKLKHMKSCAATTTTGNTPESATGRTSSTSTSSSTSSSSNLFNSFSASSITDLRHLYQQTHSQFNQKFQTLRRSLNAKTAASNSGANNSNNTKRFLALYTDKANQQQQHNKSPQQQQQQQQPSAVVADTAYSYSYSDETVTKSRLHHQNHHNPNRHHHIVTSSEAVDEMLDLAISFPGDNETVRPANGKNANGVCVTAAAAAAASAADHDDDDDVVLVADEYTTNQENIDHARRRSSHPHHNFLFFISHNKKSCASPTSTTTNSSTPTTPNNNSNTRDLLTWSSQTIQKPLIKTNSKLLKKEACELFKLVQIYMGDRKMMSNLGEYISNLELRPMFFKSANFSFPSFFTNTNNSNSNSNSNSNNNNSNSKNQQQQQSQSHNQRDLVCLEIIKKGWRYGAALRDELFLQIVKQITNNNSAQRNESVLLGWQLLAVALAFFPPSHKLAPLMADFVNFYSSSDYSLIQQLVFDQHQTQSSSSSAAAAAAATSSSSIKSSSSNLLRHSPSAANVLLSPSSSSQSSSSSDLAERFAKTTSACRKRLAKINVTGAKKGLRSPTLDEVVLAKHTIVTPSLFGTTLGELMSAQRAKFPQFTLPWIQIVLSEAVIRLNGARTEGIFRVPGDLDEVNNLKVRLDTYWCADETVADPSADQRRFDSNLSIMAGMRDPHLPASLLKLWYRELHEPLIPDQFYDECVEHCHSPEACVSVVARLPAIHRLVFTYLIRFLQLFADKANAAVTKMDAANLSMIMAPNCLRTNATEARVIMENTKKEMQFIRTLITHLDTSGLDALC